MKLLLGATAGLPSSVFDERPRTRSLPALRGTRFRPHGVCHLFSGALALFFLA